MTIQTGDVIYTLAVSSLVSGYSLDRRQCVPAKATLKLAPQGLPHLDSWAADSCSAIQ